MKIAVGKPIFLALFFITSLKAADIGTNYTLDDIITQVTNAHHDLETILAAPANRCNIQGSETIQESSFWSFHKCSYDKLCRPLVDNRNNHVLYESPEGYTVPNFRLIEVERMMLDCKKIITDKYLKESLPEQGKVLLKNIEQSRKELDQMGFKKVQQEKLATDFIKRLEKKSSAANGRNKMQYLDAKSIGEAKEEFQISNNFFPGGEFENKFFNGLSYEIDLLQSLDDKTYNYYRSSEIIIKDPFQNPELFVHPEQFGISAEGSEKNKQLLKKKETRVAAIFEEVKSKMLKVLENRANQQNRKVIDQMKARVETITQMQIPLDETLINYCESPNAFYSPIQHQFVICPQFLDIPESQLMLTIGHELSHSIDPCTMGFDFERSADPITSIETWKPVRREFGDNLREDREGLMIGVGVDKNPFASVISCLQERGSVNAITPAKSAVDAHFALEALTFDPPISREMIEDAAAKKWACGGSFGRSQINEAFADWMGTETLASTLKEVKDPIQARREAIESVMIFTGLDCKEISESAVIKRAELFQKTNGCYEVFHEKQDQYEKLREDSDVHSDSRARVERLVIANPEFEKVLGCKSKGKHCE